MCLRSLGGTILAGLRVTGARPTQTVSLIHAQRQEDEEFVWALVLNFSFNVASHS